MGQLKHSEGITAHLQRIFIYGDEVRETHRVNSFLEYLNTHINPFTVKPYELGARSLYRYISGEQHFPIDLMNPLVSWSLDEKLMLAYNVCPTPSDRDRLREKIEAEEQDIKKHEANVELMRLVLRKRP